MIVLILLGWSESKILRMTEIIQIGIGIGIGLYQEEIDQEMIHGLFQEEIDQEMIHGLYQEEIDLEMIHRPHQKEIDQEMIHRPHQKEIDQEMIHRLYQEEIALIQGMVIEVEDQIDTELLLMIVVLLEYMMEKFICTQIQME